MADNAQSQPDPALPSPIPAFPVEKIDKPPGDVILEPPFTAAQASVSKVSFIAQQYTAPLPPPEVLAAYNAQIPDAAERFLRMVERESDHRRKIEMMQAQATIDDQQAQRSETQRGQYCALGLGISALICATIAGVSGAPAVGIALGGGGLAALLSVFFVKRHDEKKEQKEKDKEAKEAKKESPTLPKSGGPA